MSRSEIIKKSIAAKITSRSSLSRIASIADSREELEEIQVILEKGYIDGAGAAQFLDTIWEPLERPENAIFAKGYLMGYEGKPYPQII